MHAAEREKAIMSILQQRGFIAVRELEQRMDASPATLRRDLGRLESEGRIQRVRGGARLVTKETDGTSIPATISLAGVPFHENIGRHRAEKQAIGKAAAALCQPETAVMIDGGSTTLQMCRHLDGLKLQVLTNSLHIVSALLNQKGTRVLVPGGMVFPEQNIILSATGDELMPKFFAPMLFMGAASVGRRGVMQADVVLVEAERRLIDRAEQLILMVDSSKFIEPSGNVVCELAEVDTVVTDTNIRDKDVSMLEAAGVKVIAVEPEG
ncbi:MAG TPA: DeoR/GlpR family DNA-binding transcription regulator [Pseudomonadales bacterium]